MAILLGGLCAFAFASSPWLARPGSPRLAPARPGSPVARWLAVLLAAAAAVFDASLNTSTMAMRKLDALCRWLFLRGLRHATRRLQRRRRRSWMDAVDKSLPFVYRFAGALDVV